MTQTRHSHYDKATKPLTRSWIPPEFAEFGGKPVVALIEMQKQLLDSFDEANRAWLARARLEAVFGIELVNKLAMARSVSAVAAAYGECMNRQLDMLAEDGSRILDDSRKLINSSTRLFADGATGRAT